MKRTNSIERHRNIGIIAHIDSGKTTVSERILFYTGVTHKIGEVHEGNTVMDHLPQERERGITITSAATTCFWSGTEKDKPEHRINLIDTPGHIDFGVEVQRSLRVLDGAVAVFCAVGGVQPQSETVWRQANQYGVPRIAFINKMDRTGANFFGVVEQLEKQLKVRAVILSLPVGSEENFSGLIDVINKKKIIWKDDEMSISELNSDESIELEKHRVKCVEIAAESSDELMEKFINNQELSVEEINSGIRALTIESKIVPVICGSAFKNKGIQFLLDNVLNFLPSPLDVKPQIGHWEDKEILVHAGDDKPFVGLVFKVVNDAHMGQISFFRVYQGTLNDKSELFVPERGKTEHIGRIVEIHANQQLPKQCVFSGDIAAFVGLKNVATGVTLTAKNFPVVLERISIAEPVVFASIEAGDDTEQKKLSVALNKMTLEDPSLSLKVDKETGQTIVGGRGELHLEVMCDRLKTEHGVTVRLGKPEVAFRETITQEIEAEGKYVKQTGGKGHHGHVWFRFKPLPIGSGIVFKNELKGGVIPHQFISSIEAGIKAGAERGIVDGYPLTDFEAILFDGSTHRVDSADLDFKMAAEIAVRQMVKASPVLLEPIMKLNLESPEEYFGTVLSIVSSLKGTINSTTDSHGAKQVNAEVPLQNLFGFTKTLRSQTQGKAFSGMEFSRYEKVSGNSKLKLKM